MITKLPKLIAEQINVGPVVSCMPLLALLVVTRAVVIGHSHQHAVSVSFQIEWLKRANIPFQATRHLINPYNEHRRVQTSRDGQEVQPQVGSALCRLWERPGGPPAAGGGGGTQLSYGLEQAEDPPAPGPAGGQQYHQPPPGQPGPASGGQAGPPQGFTGRPIRGKTYPPPAQQGRGYYRGQGYRQ